MNRRQKIIISVTGIFLVLLILVGLTYAYFLTQIQGNEEDKSITVTTANLVLEYGDGNGILETDKLEPSNGYIKFKDSQGNPVDSKIFTVTNKGNATVEGYKVYLENVQNQLVRKDDLVYTLSCASYTNYGEETQALVGDCNGVSNETRFPDVITSIVSNDISVGVTHVYELKAKYKEMGVDQSIDMNKLITAKINIHDASTKFLAREIINNANSDETVTYNKTSYIEPSLQDGESYTIPAEQINNEDERIMTYTFDDLGTSYYYRGNVEDNYVNFADMCWRIVRIEGDGSVKLILEDQDQLCNSKDTNGILNMDGNFNIPTETDGTSYTGNYGYEYNYVTNTSGETSSREKTIMNYLEPVTYANNSMVKAFYDFQTVRLRNYKSKLKSGDWCLMDTPYSTDSNIAPYEYRTLLSQGKNIKDLQYDGETVYYDSYVRLLGDGTNGYEPTLKCTGTKLNNFVDVIYESEKIVEEAPMYVSTLTADEIVYAGGKVDIENNNYYLLNEYFKSGNAGYSYFCSLSPSISHRYVGDRVFIVGKDGYLDNDGVHYDSLFRPSVSLKAGIVTTGGEGTLKKPYIISD